MQTSSNIQPNHTSQSGAIQATSINPVTSGIMEHPQKTQGLISETSFPTALPTSLGALRSLFRADLTTLWRNRKSAILVILVPCIILISWKGLVERLGGNFVLSNCITVGLNAIGLMGYSISIARDREKGVFQRLRVSPLPNWSIMTSRLLVQLMMIIIMTLVVYYVGYRYDHISFSTTSYLVGLIMATIGGAVYLSLGQAVVGLIKNPETVNSTVRLIYFAFIMIGLFAGTGALGKTTEAVAKWTPYGTVNQILGKSMDPATWNAGTTGALLITLAYTVVFAGLGIKWFRWSPR